MVRGFVLFLSFITLPCLAGICQAPRFQFGIAVPLQLNMNDVQVSGVARLHPGNYGIDFCLKIKGNGERALSFLQITGLGIDRLLFGLSKNEKLYMSRYCINVNPTIVFPSGRGHIFYFLGIGALINVGQDIGYYSYNLSRQQHYQGLDTINQILTTRSHKITPFISAGIIMDIHTHFKAQLFVSQGLLNAFEGNTKLFYMENNHPREATMSYLPTALGLRLIYFLGSERDK
jgi:hypothetical protein